MKLMGRRESHLVEKRNEPRYCLALARAAPAWKIRRWEAFRPSTTRIESGNLMRIFKGIHGRGKPG